MGSYIEFIRKCSKKMKMSPSTLETVKSDKHISRLRVSSFTRDQKFRERVAQDVGLPCPFKIST